MKQRVKQNRMISFLEIHSITKRQRAKMVDWMLEVMRLFQQTSETIFRAIFILDLYFKRRKNPINTNELHLLGVVSIFIASKLCEVRPLKLKNVLDEICKSKFSKAEILKWEKEILSVVMFDINSSTINTFSKTLIEILDFPEVCKDSIAKHALLLQKMFLYNYDILNVFTYDQLAMYSLIISLKLFEFTHKGFSAQKFNSKLLKLIQVRKQEILGNLNFLRDFASGFKNVYTFNNLQSSQ